jgi:hypothetical protein
MLPMSIAQPNPVDYLVLLRESPRLVTPDLTILQFNKPSSACALIKCMMKCMMKCCGTWRVIPCNGEAENNQGLQL